MTNNKKGKGKATATTATTATTAAKKEEQKVTVLHDNPPLPGKKFFLASMISPESPQKHNVHGFKMHDMCETEDEARALCRYYHNLDPDFDVLVGAVGKWCPWVFDPLAISNVEYANEQLTSLVRSHRMTQDNNNAAFRAKVDKHVENIKREGTKEGQEELSKKQEPAISMLFKIKQLESVVERRQIELEILKELYNEKYSEEDRSTAEAQSLPDVPEPAPMQYSLLGGDGSSPESQASSSGNNLIVEEDRFQKVV